MSHRWCEVSPKIDRATAVTMSRRGVRGNPTNVRAGLSTETTRRRVRRTTTHQQAQHECFKCFAFGRFFFFACSSWFHAFYCPCFPVFSFHFCSFLFISFVFPILSFYLLCFSCSLLLVSIPFFSVPLFSFPGFSSSFSLLGLSWALFCTVVSPLFFFFGKERNLLVDAFVQHSVFFFFPVLSLLSFFSFFRPFSLFRLFFSVLSSCTVSKSRESEPRPNEGTKHGWTNIK